MRGDKSEKHGRVPGTPLTRDLSWGVCTAYEIGKRGGSLPERVKAEAAEELLQIRGTSIVRPTHLAPVILPDGSLETMIWGFRREMAAKTKGKKTWRTIVNSREDKLTGGTWRDAFERRRCLIPAASFYEWVVREGRNVPLRFERPGDEWLWIAGIWEEDSQGDRRFSMITTEPNREVGQVHDRMPAVLSDGRIGPFLEGDLREFGPSTVPLVFAETPNFLKRNGPPVTPQAEQGELF